MITLSIPANNENYFVWYRSLAFGPMDQYGKLVLQTSTLQSGLRRLLGKKAILGENDVDHLDVHASLGVYSYASQMTPTPTSQFPDATRIITEYLGKPLAVSTGMGFPSNGRSYRSYDGANNSILHHYAFFRDQNNFWTYIEVVSNVSNPKRITGIWYRQFVQYPTLTNSNCRMKYRYWESTTGVETDYDWRSSQSADVIWSLYAKLVYSLPMIGSDVPMTVPVSFCRVYGGAMEVINPNQIRNRIDAHLASLIGDGFPVPEVPYGDLAMEASDKIARNHVNMIAFIRDLRHPQELIPKLKNLKTLKGISGNYLSVVYGILPTISDLSAIVEAAKKIGPYLDRNGFSTYSASRASSVLIDNVSYRREQHIKLAISNEESFLCSLIQRMEDIGTFPTLENLWDLLPYSFVLDWFIDVGEFLERCDSRLRLARLDIRYTTSSDKQTIKLNISPAILKIPCSGPVELVQYHRWVSDQCPVPPLSLKPNSQGFDHWIEASALILQRR